jgi:hypothetical protein
MAGPRASWFLPHAQGIEQPLRNSATGKQTGQECRLNNLTQEGCEIFVFMASLPPDTALPTRFFSPLLDLLPACQHRRHCPDLADADWLRLGIQRCLQPQASGRGFLQALATLGVGYCPENSYFFESLKSQRRLTLCAEINARLCAHLTVNDQQARKKEHDMRALKRLEQAAEIATKAGEVLPKTLRLVQQITQHSVKLIRWVATQLWHNISWQQACAVLMTLYAKL